MVEPKDAVTVNIERSRRDEVFSWSCSKRIQREVCIKWQI